MSFSRSRQTGYHTARGHVALVTVYYPYHPQFKNTLHVLYEKRFKGEDHIVVEQPDGSYAFLPKWMTLPEAAASPISFYS